jgi:hypothetical protein
MSSENIPSTPCVNVTNQSPPSDPRHGPPGRFSPSKIIELASGVDALYLSGRASLPGELLGRLEVAREEATRANEAQPFLLGGVEFRMKPHGWQLYRYCLDHPLGRVGFTMSNRLPAIRVQPHTEFIQGSSPRPMIEWYRDLLESECGAVLFSVTRLDLFADFQGWDLNGDMRREFMCRAKSLTTFEEDENFNGLNFGKRDTGTFTARLYDKTIRAEQNGEGYWKMIWGEAFDPTKSVLRIEFEINRTALRQFDLSSPEDVLDGAGALWAYLTSEWLTHRVPGVDMTKARWPISPQWEVVRHAFISENGHGLNRVYLGKRRGGVANIMPSLEGYLASFGAYAQALTLDQLLPHLKDSLAQRERDTGVSFGERVAEKRRKFGLL